MGELLWYYPDVALLALLLVVLGVAAYVGWVPALVAVGMGAFWTALVTVGRLRS